MGCFVSYVSTDFKEYLNFGFDFIIKSNPDVQISYLDCDNGGYHEKEDN